MDAERYIARIKARAGGLAQEALLKPKQRDSFEYGLQAGIQQGLAIALEELERSQDEADGRKPEARPARSNPYAQ